MTPTTSEREAFAAWLAREMPPGTVISNPAWWAPRIIAALTREQREVPPGLYDLDPYRLPQQEAQQDSEFRRGFELNVMDWQGIVPPPDRGPEPDPETGADRGTCCAHAYADGFNDCRREVLKRAAEQPQQEAQGAVAVELTKCCGREECGGECGNEWRGTEFVRVATPPAPVDVRGLRTLANDLRNEAGDWDIGSTRGALKDAANRIDALLDGQPAGVDDEAARSGVGCNSLLDRTHK